MKKKNKKLTVNASLIKKVFVQNKKTKKKEIDSLVPIAPESFTFNLPEYQAIAMEWSVKVLEELGFRLVIDIQDYKDIAKQLDKIKKEKDEDTNS